MTRRRERIEPVPPGPQRRSGPPVNDAEWQQLSIEIIDEWERALAAEQASRRRHPTHRDPA